MNIRAASAADCARMAAIDAACNPSPWSEGQFRAALDNRCCTVLLAEENHAAAAFAVWQSVAGESELHLIATAPAARRKGFAAALLRRWLDDCAAQNAERLFLEVRAGNGAAQSLYRKYGFTETARRPAYYSLPEGGREDALIMEKIC
ncbi:ribosomal-protein-alanine N-acetyltransferase [Kingella potus]|uniref:[Ribosomal protein bS18]-alanine N-acetyltransferase n=1 Tax=Kingella potus TaxID=265175 RepID=A0A377QZL6_9NEIS|nr:ribosomal protein S18-alanine N-acetyltransferase [Kingella potus]UOP00809.1 ribosomal protein S18-alanine N-acetyltransferase [Kingella potus]STR00447.1 ribosomal-protein-alanine N-acetyltransferase [Kingella potus]